MRDWINEFIDMWNGFRDWATENQFEYLRDGDPSLDILYDVVTEGPLPPSWSANADQTAQFEFMFSNTPFYGDWLRMRDNVQWMSDYLKNTGQTWSDMLYPSKAPGAGSVGSFAMDAINFTSRNLEKFYR